MAFKTTLPHELLKAALHKLLRLSLFLFLSILRFKGFARGLPGRVLQSAADLAHLLFPEIHHRQMDPAVLAHAHFSAKKRQGGSGIRDESAFEKKKKPQQD